MEVLLGVEHSHESSPDDQSSSAHDHYDLQFQTWTYESSAPINLGLLQQLLNHLPGTLLKAGVASSTAPRNETTACSRIRGQSQIAKSEVSLAFPSVSDGGFTPEVFGRVLNPVTRSKGSISLNESFTASASSWSARR